MQKQPPRWLKITVGICFLGFLGWGVKSVDDWWNAQWAAAKIPPRILKVGEVVQANQIITCAGRVGLAFPEDHLKVVRVYMDDDGWTMAEFRNIDRVGFSGCGMPVTERLIAALSPAQETRSPAPAGRFRTAPR